MPKTGSIDAAVVKPNITTASTPQRPRAYLRGSNEDPSKVENRRSRIEDRRSRIEVRPRIEDRRAKEDQGTIEDRGPRTGQGSCILVRTSVLDFVLYEDEEDGKKEGEGEGEEDDDSDDDDHDDADDE